MQEIHQIEFHPGSCVLGNRLKGQGGAGRALVYTSAENDRKLPKLGDMV